jgi:hypothetical protein
MKVSLCVLLLAVALASTGQSGAATLPDACGNDNVQFDVTTKKHQPVPAPAEAGKSQIIFIEVLDKTWGCWDCGTPSARFGVDGAWVGATKGNSYFAIDVPPGEHHLCAGWQSAFGHLRQMVGMASLHAEAGKTYYFEAKVRLHKHQYGTGTDSSAEMERKFDLLQVNEDEGKYRIRSSPLSTFKPSQ